MAGIGGRHLARLAPRGVSSESKTGQSVPSLRLSPTAVICFRQCPLQYKFRYIDRLGDEYGGPRPYFTMGNHVHDTLKEFLTRVPLDERNVDNIVRLLRKNWRRYRVGFRGQEDERRWAEKALTQVSCFVRSHDVRVRPYLVEASFEAEITPGLVLQGRMDRVDLQSDGTLHIIDYKTGNTPEVADRTQLFLNALVLSRRLPHPVTRASFLYLSSGFIDSAPVSVEVLDQARWELLLTAQRISRGNNFRAQPGAVCRRCDFRPICRLHAETAKAQATGDHLNTHGKRAGQRLPGL